MKISDDEAAICTTGWPFTLQGTSMPLTIRRRLGTSKINELASDVFSLAQLAWTAPNPVCVKDFGTTS
jgi:hypothetical protein